MAFTVFIINLAVFVASLKLYIYLYGGKKKEKKQNAGVYREIFLGIVDGFKEQHRIGK